MMVFEVFSLLGFYTGETDLIYAAFQDLTNGNME